MHPSLAAFHPLIGRWFEKRFGDPTEPQLLGWPAIRAGHDTLIAAPTGSGKTLAAFLSAIDALLGRARLGALEDRTHVVYVSPLKALGNDIARNLEEPLSELRALSLEDDIALPEIRAQVRTGDTPSSERERMARNPPHILITTPESLFILLTSERGRRSLLGVSTVIVDEIHAVASDKRGAHLSLSLERLDALVTSDPSMRRPVRIGLSATQRPIEEIAKLLGGANRPLPVIVDCGLRREIDLAILVPGDELGAVASNEMMQEAYDRIAELVRSHRSTLVFVNTRRLVERVAHQLAERLGEDQVAAHHGSLSRTTRLLAEQRLKKNEIPCVVATASLELGIDVGTVDLVVQIGSPRSIATFLQRVGRSGHSKSATPKGRLFALTRDQLVECAALVRAARRRTLDLLRVREAPLDILAQQIVAACAAEDWDEEVLFALVCRSYPYEKLERARFEAILEMLSEGIATDRGRSRTYLHRDRIQGRLRARRGARLVAITSGGAIPDLASYSVVADPEEVVVGSLDEDFAVESMAGDIFLLGNTSWSIRRVEATRVRVEDARGAPPTIPFWRGEAPARTKELSDEVSLFREEIDGRLTNKEAPDQIIRWIEDEAAVEARGAEQVLEYLSASRSMLGALPSSTTIIAERFFDEAGGMQLILHAPFGGRINRAWGLALRKCFCRSFNFELQAAATDDGILISLGPMHSFPLETVFEFLSPESVEHILTQAVLAAPMFGTRWRWNAQRSLAVPRNSAGQRVPAPLLRMRTDDLLASIFPEQQACKENAPGDISIPDHPLVFETLRDCLQEAMDLQGLERLLVRMKGGKLTLIARDTPEPSPLSHEILNANPYAYLDDAPLEERRARAVALRRSLPPDLREGIGALDREAIARANEEARPAVRDAEELHDLLLTLGVLPEEIGVEAGWSANMDALQGDLRVTRAENTSPAGVCRRYWIAAERVPLAEAAFGALSMSPKLAPLPYAHAPWSRESAAIALVRAHLDQSGPHTASAIAHHLGLDEPEVDAALHGLEAEGAVLRGRFTPKSRERIESTEPVEWCERRILARIHRLTLGRLRSEIAPVSQAHFMRFLFRWQHAFESTRLSGASGLAQVVAQLQGTEMPAHAWEKEVLPLRIRDYDPGDLDLLCLSGEVAWGRLTLRGREDATEANRATSIGVFLREDLPWLLVDSSEANGEAHSGAEATGPSADHAAADVLRDLERHGASFFWDLVRRTRRVPSEIEDALRELVFSGHITGDVFSALRSLLNRRIGAAPRALAKGRFRRPSLGAGGVGPGADGGRWSLMRPAGASTSAFDPEAHASQLLLRYGVVLRDLLAREGQTCAWRDLLTVFRRMEARGDVRGGRFVSGFSGEQYALPDAVEGLRAVAKRPASPTPETVTVSACDPLNLVWITSPGPRVPARIGNFVRYVDGVPVGVSASVPMDIPMNGET